VQTIRIHTVVDAPTISYALDLFRSMKILAVKPDKIAFYIYCLEKSNKISSEIKEFEAEYNVTVNTFDVFTQSRGSVGHAEGLNQALSNIPAECNRLNIICDSDTLVVAKHWDSALRYLINTRQVGAFGTTYENIGGFTSGTGITQTYKNLPNFVWMAVMPGFPWNTLDASSSVDKTLKLSAEDCLIHNLPPNSVLLRDVGWKIPSFLAKYEISSVCFKYLHPSFIDSVVLKNTNWDYHEEYHLQNIPFVVHQRGARKFKWNVAESAKFRSEAWKYINRVKDEPGPDWGSILADVGSSCKGSVEVAQRRGSKSRKEQPQPRAERRAGDGGERKKEREIAQNVTFVNPMSEYSGEYYTKNTDYLLVTCSLEESRTKVLRQVISNLKDQKIDPARLTIFDNASTIPGVVDELVAAFPESVYQCSHNIGYWSAIWWWLRNRVSGQYTYIIESDLIHYDMHRLYDAEQLLDLNPLIGSVRTIKFEVNNASSYYKTVVGNKRSSVPLVSRQNNVTSQDIYCSVINPEKGLYYSNFLTHLPALNRTEAMMKVFERLSSKGQFDEFTFQSYYWGRFQYTGVLDRGIMSYDCAQRDGKVLTGSWTDPARLKKIGYKNSRNGNIEPDRSYTVHPQSVTIVT